MDADILLKYEQSTKETESKVAYADAYQSR